MATKSKAARAKGAHTETQAAVSGLADRLAAIVENINQQRAVYRDKEKAADELRNQDHAVEPEREVIHLSKPDTLTYLACDLRTGLLRANSRANAISDLLFRQGDLAGVTAAAESGVPGLSDLLDECGTLLNALNVRLSLIEGRL